MLAAAHAVSVGVISYAPPHNYKEPGVARARQATAEEEGEADIPGVDSALLKRLLRAAAAREVPPSGVALAALRDAWHVGANILCSLQRMACLIDGNGDRALRIQIYLMILVVSSAKQDPDLHAPLPRM
jgi:hypothetical protein